MDYTVIGDSVNLASRLQDITKAFRVAIIVDAETAAQVGDTHPLRELDRIRVRGRQSLERIYEVMIESEPATRIVAYRDARAKLSRRDWEGAAKAFDAILSAWPGDGPAALMRDRARGALAAPPPADWDGVW
jgi:adenylate cyclase